MKDVGNVTAPDVEGRLTLRRTLSSDVWSGGPAGENVAICGAKSFLVASVAVCARLAVGGSSQLAYKFKSKEKSTILRKGHVSSVWERVGNLRTPHKAILHRWAKLFCEVVRMRFLAGFSLSRRIASLSGLFRADGLPRHAKTGR